VDAQPGSELVQREFDVTLSLGVDWHDAGAIEPDGAKTVCSALTNATRKLSSVGSMTYISHCQQAHKENADIFFWDESGFRADSVHGRTWAPCGETPVVKRPGERQSMSAASAVNSKGAFWFATYEGGLSGELFVTLLKKLMFNRRKAVHLVVDGLPAHKKAIVKEYVASTQGKLTLHFLPGLRAGPQSGMSWCGATSNAPASHEALCERAKSWDLGFTNSSHRLDETRSSCARSSGIHLSAIFLTYE